jgi:hypothetical protein
MTFEQFVQLWAVKRLRIHDLNSLVRKNRTCSIPDELGRLAAQRGVTLSTDEAYGIINALFDWADNLGFWPLDPSPEPEEWEGRDAELPLCVLATDDAQYIDYNDMPRILALYDGHNLPDYLPEDERQARIRRQRHRPVLTTTCREDACNEKITITVAMAATAIRKHKLIESGDVYEPSTLCKKHRAERDEMLAQKRQRRNGGELRVPMKQGAKWVSKNKNKEVPDANQSAASSPVVVEEPSPPPQEPEAVPQSKEVQPEA